MGTSKLERIPIQEIIMKKELNLNNDVSRRELSKN